MLSMRPRKSWPARARDWCYSRLGGRWITDHWMPSAAISSQTIAFTYHGRPLSVQADAGTPLYETIAELVDRDAYQLERIPWPDNRAFTVIDIGANIGVSALLFAQHAGARVIAVEPVPDNARRLRENLTRNQVASVTVLEAAVAAARGAASFEVNPRATVGGRLAAAEAPGPRITVPTLTWQDLRAQAGDTAPFLVKMDCEGGEYAILDSMSDEELRAIPCLTFELHDLDRTHRMERVVDRLARCGFALTYQPDLFHRPYLHHVLALRPA